jgi:hypothetical protein
MKRKKLLIILIVLACMLNGLTAITLYKFGTAEKRHTKRAHAAYNTEFKEISKEIASNGIDLQDPTQDCSELDGDQTVLVNCYYTASGEISINDDFIQKWPAIALELSNTLNGSGWEKVPNYDPVTDNPVDTLDRLLEYKGIYHADVSYTKEYGSIRCEIYFYVIPAAESQEVTRLEIILRCNSIARDSP